MLNRTIYVYGVPTAAIQIDLIEMIKIRVINVWVGFHFFQSSIRLFRESSGFEMTPTLSMFYTQSYALFTG